MSCIYSAVADIQYVYMAAALLAVYSIVSIQKSRGLVSVLLKEDFILVICVPALRKPLR